MAQEAEGLVETLAQASSNALKATRLLESLVQSRLIDLGYFVADLWETHPPSSERLSQIASESQLEYINLISPAGKLLLSNSPGRDNDFFSSAYLDSMLADFLKSGEKDKVFTYTLPDGMLAGERMAAFVRTRKGIVNLIADQTFMKNFQQEVGIGYLIQKIAASPGVTYVVLQSPEGIVLASRDVSRMTKIEGDPFLEQALETDTTATRLTDFEGNEVFEVVRPFAMPDFPASVFRVGLSLEGFKSISASYRYQIIFFSILLFLLGLIAYGYFASDEAVRRLESSFSRLKGTTEKILEDMEAAVAACDSGGKIVLANRQAEKFFGAKEGRPVMDCFPNDELFFAEVILKQQPRTGWQLQKGEQFFLGSTSPLFGQNGKFEGAVAVVSDLTRLKKLEEEAKKSERLALLGNLAAGVAHEIRNPLNTISMAAQRLKNEFQVASEQAEFEKFLTTIEKEAHRINQSITEFLGLVKSGELHKTKTGWAGFWKELVTSAELEARPKNIKVEADPPVEVEIEIDGGELKKALFNLVRNACEATPQGGKLALKNKMVDGRLQITIQDTGPGIPADVLPKIFEPYFTTKSAGTGLGLAIAQRIIAEHGGAIQVESKLGAGTTFVVTLPLPK